MLRIHSAGQMRTASCSESEVFMNAGMKAVLLDKPTKAGNVTLSEVPIPGVRPGWVLVKVRAFGMNHSEQLLRLSEIKADYIQKPIISGIECVGEIADPSDSSFKAGEKVVALMGGMRRSFHGSYAQYALLPVHHVFAVGSALSWTDMAAVPETWFTTWGSLFECLRLSADDTLLIRGGTCALGYAAIQIAKATGCKVIATTHRESKLTLLKDADEAVRDTGRLAGTLRGVTKALELVGVLSFATVDGEGNLQVRCISAIHFDKDSFYFLPREEKTFAINFLKTGKSRYWLIPASGK